MAFGKWGKIKKFFKDFANGFKYGWNKAKSIADKIPIVGEISKKIPKFDNSNNPVAKYLGGDGYIKFDPIGNVSEEADIGYDPE